MLKREKLEYCKCCPKIKFSAMISQYEKLQIMKSMNSIRLMTFMAVLFFVTKANSQNEVKPYYPKLQPGRTEMSKVRAHIGELLKNDITISDQKNNLSDRPGNISVSEDRIEFKLKRQNTIIYFSDILFDNIIEAYESKTEKFDNGKVTTYWAYFKLGDFIFSCYFNDPVMQLANDLFSLQFNLNETRYASQLTLFEPIAKQYRALNVKPPIGEEQRKYIVQANGFNDEKQYTKAIELYKKAIEVDQTAYPAAYSNLALLSAQLNQFDAAIYNMKKYLMLEPESPDARSAQDKIYLWEAKVGI
jgi:tetratricopeptide (TPR) repeat protein